MKQLLLTIIACLAITGAATAQEATPQQKLQMMLGKKGGKDTLGQAIVVGTLLGCTQKVAGKEATQEFYNEVNAVGKNISGYCKQGYHTEAKALALSTLEKSKTDPVYKAALGCYDKNAQNITGLGGQKMADDLTKYAAWAKDTELAKREMTETDVCKNAQTTKTKEVNNGL